MTHREVDIEYIAQKEIIPKAIHVQPLEIEYCGACDIISMVPRWLFIYTFTLGKSSARAPRCPTSPSEIQYHELFFLRRNCSTLITKSSF